MNMEIFQKLSQKDQKSYIDRLDWAYYNEDNPIVSDKEYDEYRRVFEKKYGKLDYVPGGISEGFEKFRHPTPVTSLSKWTEGVDKADDFIKKVKDLWPVVVEPKYDGLTVVAYPIGDGFCKYVTRGLGGEIGEVLPNFIQRYEGPNINDSGYPIRGEVFITEKNFQELNRRLKAEGEEPMKNLRNAAAGILRRKGRSPYIDLLSYIVYDIPGLDVTPTMKKHIVASYTKFEYTSMLEYDNVEDLIEGVATIYNDYKSLGIAPLDGMVIKSCQEKSLEKFGSTGHHLRNSFAVKFEQEEKTTIVRDVIWQMGRRKATPVAIVDPVEIDGTTVTKASLHNAAQIEELGLKIGATVKIRKANQIIPQIVSVVKPGDKDIVLSVCPACGGPLQEINGQQFCVNPNCYERVAQNIAFLGKKDVLDIPGLSIQTARKIVDAYDMDQYEYGGSPQNIIFDLTVDDIKRLPGFAQKSAEKLYNAIQSAMKNVELPRFIKALCIPGIGNNIGKLLADKYGSIESMIDWIEGSKECHLSDIVETRLMKIDGIGPVAAKTIMSDEFWEAVDELSEYITPLAYKKEKKNMTGDYAGKVFVLTGKAPKPRTYYEDLIVKAGGKVGSACNSKTDYLIIADVNSTSSKAKKARELGTKLISPEELEEMV